MHSLYSIARPVSALTVRPMSVSTQCNFFLTLTVDRCTQTSPATRDKGVHCESLEFNYVNSSRPIYKSVSCQSKARQQHSIGCQAPDIETNISARSPLLKDALYLLNSLEEFNNLGYYVGSSFLYVFSLDFELERRGCPPATLTISANGKCHFHRPEFQIKTVQLDPGDNVDPLLQLLREVRKVLVYCEGISPDIVKDVPSRSISTRSPGCKVWVEENIASNAPGFRCSDCKVLQRRLKRQQASRSVLPEVHAKRLKPNSNYSISRLPPSSQKLRMHALRRSKLNLVRKFNRLKERLMTEVEKRNKDQSAKLSSVVSILKKSFS